MKRLIAGLVCALMLSATACAQEYQNVSQLRESAPARWTTTIETKWRGVAIDAKIVTPNVEAIPVVKVVSTHAGGKRMDDYRRFLRNGRHEHLSG